MPEYKSYDLTAVKAIDGRTVTGIASVFGNVDAYGDIIWPGAYAKTLQENRKRLKHFWNHSWLGWADAEPPIAAISDIREVTRDELPPSVLELAPDALGGLQVSRMYLNTPRGNEVLEGIREGTITEMSIGYEAIKYDYDTANGVDIRNLREIRLLETSDVIWGANDATAASKRLPDLAALLSAFETYAKAGRRNSDEDQQRINAICRLAYELGADYQIGEGDGYTPDDEEKVEPPDQALTLRNRARALELRMKLAGVKQ